MLIVAWAAEALIFLFFKSAFFSSRPPPEPLERRPSPLIALVLSTGLGEKQVTRVAALTVVTGMTAVALVLSCGEVGVGGRARRTGRETDALPGWYLVETMPLRKRSQDSPTRLRRTRRDGR